MRTQRHSWKRRLAWLAVALLVLAGTAAAVLAYFGHSPGSLMRDARLRADIHTIGRQAQEGLRQSGNQATRQLAGPLLARSITHSRARALAAGTFPVPDDIRCLLERHFLSIDFDEVRWMPSGGDLTLGNVLTRWYLQEGAVVLQDVVVFSSPQAAQGRRLWAHELTHVLQYQELGLEEFAHAYAVNALAFERQAEDHAQAVVARLDDVAFARCGLRLVGNPQ